LATTATKTPCESEIDEDPELTSVYDGHPLLATDLAAIRRRYDALGAAHGAHSRMDVPRLLAHIEWLTDQHERLKEQRDTLSDMVAGPAQVFAQNLDTVK